MLKLIEAPACNDSADARSAMADMLTAHPKLGGVFSVCDIIATGAARVLVAKGRDAVAHVSVDASKQGVDAILQHKGIDAEVAQHLLKVGQSSVTTLAQALAPAIRVNAVAPGPTLRNERQSGADFARQRAATILGGGAAPHDVCEAVRYLVGASAVTGQTIAVDGGQHLIWPTPAVSVKA